MPINKELKRIPFIPDFQLQNVSARKIEQAIYDYLIGLVDNLRGVKVEMTGKRIAIQIAISANSSDIQKNAAMAFGEVENPFILTNDLKDKLSMFLDINKDIKTSFIPKTKKGPIVIVDLNTMKTIKNIFAAPTEGYEYSINGIIPQKNNSILQLAMKKIIKQDN